MKDVSIEYSGWRYKYYNGVYKQCGSNITTSLHASRIVVFSELFGYESCMTKNAVVVNYLVGG